MSNPQVTFLTLHGVPSTVRPNSTTTFFSRDPQGDWLPNHRNYLSDIESVCVRLHDALASRIFGSVAAYWEFSPTAPEMLRTAGMNSECPMSKQQFASTLSTISAQIPTNQALYLYDCRKLVAGIQECSKEVMQLQGELYQALNLEALFAPDVDEPDGLRWVTSPVVTKIFALLGFIYIRLHSLLDYSTKLAIEIEGLRADFSRYPKLSSKNKLYSDRRQVSFNGSAGTLFEKCAELTEIEAVRNHIIHEGLLDDMPKVYRLICDGTCVEKFILFPDRVSEGWFESFTNRNLFYGGEDKINLRLPSVISDFQLRLVETMRQLLEHLNSTAR